MGRCGVPGSLGTGPRPLGFGLGGANQLDARALVERNEDTLAFDGVLEESNVLGGARFSGTIDSSRFFVGIGATLTMSDFRMRKSSICDNVDLRVTNGWVACATCNPDIEKVTLSGVDVSTSDCPSLEQAAETDPEAPTVPTFEFESD